MAPATLLVAHGSPDPRSAAVVRRIARATGTIATFLEFNEPTPMTVLKELSEAGHNQATLVPLLLTRAYHGRVDVPNLVRRAADEFPRIWLDVADTIGDWLLEPALRRGAGDADALVLAAAGTRDTEARNGIAGLAANLEYRTQRPCVAAYASAARPGIVEAIDGLRSRGARRVAVLSYFIAPGALHDRIREGARTFGSDVRVTEPLGTAPELLDVVRSRARSSAVSRELPRAMFV